MARQPGIQVEGLSAAIKQVRQYENVDKELKEAGEEAAKILISAALPLVPVRSGLLKTTLRPSKIVRGAQAKAGNSKARYAGPIHWGWAKRGIKPQPFFSTALGYTKDEIIANYKRSLEKLIYKLNK